MKREKKTYDNLAVAIIVISLFIWLFAESLSAFHALTHRKVAFAWGIWLLCWLVYFVLNFRKEGVSDQAISFKIDEMFREWTLFEYVLLFFVIFLSGTMLVLSYRIVPNNWDSMTYHLARVMNWIQNGSVEYYPTNNPRQLYYSNFSEYVILYIDVALGFYILTTKKLQIKEQMGRNPMLYAMDFYNVYWDTMLENMQLFGYVEPLLEELKESGIKIGILTDLTAHIQYRKLSKLCLSDKIDYLVTSEEAGAEKPSDKMFNLMLDKFGMLSEEVLMVGDSQKKDIDGARNAGMECVLVENKNICVLADEIKASIFK